MLRCKERLVYDGWTLSYCNSNLSHDQIKWKFREITGAEDKNEYFYFKILIMNQEYRRYDRSDDFTKLMHMMKMSNTCHEPLGRT